MNVKDFILEFGQEAKKYIVYFEQFKELTGEQKKDRVVDVLGSWVERAIGYLPINAVVKFILKKLIMAGLPHIVQVAFNLIESKVEGITK